MARFKSQAKSSINPSTTMLSNVVCACCNQPYVFADRAKPPLSKAVLMPCACCASSTAWATLGGKANCELRWDPSLRIADAWCPLFPDLLSATQSSQVMSMSPQHRYDSSNGEICARTAAEIGTSTEFNRGLRNFVGEIPLPPLEQSPTNALVYGSSTSAAPDQGVTRDSHGRDNGSRATRWGEHGESPVTRVAGTAGHS